MVVRRYSGSDIFAMISFQLYNQESVASIAVSFAVKLVILQSLFIIRSALRVRRLNIQMTNENRGLSCEEAQKRLYAGYGNVQVKISPNLSDRLLPVTFLHILTSYLQCLRHC